MPEQPFHHQVVNNAFSPITVELAACEWPSHHERNATWVAYNSALERKQTCCHWPDISHASTILLLSMAQQVPQREGGFCLSDLSLYGGGLCSMTRGDFLTLHLDRDHHPVMGLSHRLVAVLFLEDWQEDWGGQLQLWDAERRAPVVSISPAANRLVLIETWLDCAYHSVSPLTCPEGMVRKSLVMSFYSYPFAPERRLRPRALFVPTADEPPDPRKEQLRKERAG